VEVTDTPAYIELKLITVIKSLIVQAPRLLNSQFHPNKKKAFIEASKGELLNFACKYYASM
jgi:hypothetical protein